MHFGLIGFIKSFAPWMFYAFAVFMILFALIGKVRWPLLFATFLLPLRNVVEKLQAFPGGTKLLSILILAIIIGSCISKAAQKTKTVERLPLGGIWAALILYMFISLQIGNVHLGTNSLFDVSDPRVQDWKNFCLFPLLYIATFNIIRDEKWVWRVFMVMCAAMILMNYYTVSQTQWFSSLGSRAKIRGTFQYLGPNEVAAFYSQYSILLLSIFLFLKNKRHRIWLIPLILVNIYCLIFMYSRGAYLGFAVGLFFLFLIKRKRYLVPLFLVLILWQTILPQNAVERIQETMNKYGELDISAAQRLDIWSVSIALFEKNPIFGIGYGVFRHLGIIGLQDTHNIYVKYLVEQGLVGLIIFLAILFCFFKQGIILFRKGENDFSKSFGLGFAIMVVVLMVNNFFGDRWSYLELSAYLWICAGLVARLNTMAQNQPSVSPLEQRAETGRVSLKKQKKKRYYDL